MFSGSDRTRTLMPKNELWTCSVQQSQNNQINKSAKLKEESAIYNFLRVISFAVELKVPSRLLELNHAARVLTTSLQIHGDVSVLGIYV